MNIIFTFLSICFIFLFGILPFRVLYVVSDISRFVLQHLAGYRKKVIRSTLERCFPEKDVAEIDKLVTGFYRNLTDVLVEGFKAFTMTRKQFAKRHRILNPELLDAHRKAKKSFIATPCHYGNWEWGALAPALQLREQVIGFYTPLSNPYMDKFIRRNRSRTGAILVSTSETSATFERLRDTPSVFIMAADQSPSKPEKAHWVDFLGQKTAFLDGPERHAREKDYPVVFADIQRVKRGYYELELSYISENPRQTQVGEITAEYARRLETVIRKDPRNWLWSHKRWKLNDRLGLDHQ